MSTISIDKKDLLYFDNNLFNVAKQTSVSKKIMNYGHLYNGVLLISDQKLPNRDYVPITLYTTKKDIDIDDKLIYLQNKVIMNSYTSDDILEYDQLTSTQKVSFVCLRSLSKHLINPLSGVYNEYKDCFVLLTNESGNHVYHAKNAKGSVVNVIEFLKENKKLILGFPKISDILRLENDLVVNRNAPYLHFHNHNLRYFNDDYTHAFSLMRVNEIEDELDTLEYKVTLSLRKLVIDFKNGYKFVRSISQYDVGELYAMLLNYKERISLPILPEEKTIGFINTIEMLLDGAKYRITGNSLEEFTVDRSFYVSTTAKLKMYQIDNVKYNQMANNNQIWLFCGNRRSPLTSDGIVPLNYKNYEQYKLNFIDPRLSYHHRDRAEKWFHLPDYIVYHTYKNHVLSKQELSNIRNMGYTFFEYNHAKEFYGYIEITKLSIQPFLDRFKITYNELSMICKYNIPKNMTKTKYKYLGSAAKAYFFDTCLGGFNKKFKTAIQAAEELLKKVQNNKRVKKSRLKMDPCHKLNNFKKLIKSKKYSINETTENIVNEILSYKNVYIQDGIAYDIKMIEQEIDVDVVIDKIYDLNKLSKKDRIEWIRGEKIGMTRARQAELYKLEPDLVTKKVKKKIKKELVNPIEIRIPLLKTDNLKVGRLYDSLIFQFTKYGILDVDETLNILLNKKTSNKLFKHPAKFINKIRKSFYFFKKGFTTIFEEKFNIN